MVPVTEFGVAVVLVLAVPVAVLATVATVPLLALEPVIRFSKARSDPAGIRLRFQYHAVLVGLAEDGRDLPLAERVVQRVLDRLHRHAEPAGLFAIDLMIGAEAVVLLVGGDVPQHRQAAQLPQQQVGPFATSAVGVHQRVLELRAADARADLDVLHRLEIDRDAGNVGDCRASAAR